MSLHSFFHQVNICCAPGQILSLDFILQLVAEEILNPEFRFISLNLGNIDHGVLVDTFRLSLSENFSI